MKKEKEEKRKISKAWTIILTIITCIALVTNAYSIYNILLLGPIESLIRYIIVGIMILIDLIIIIKLFIIYKRHRKPKHSILMLFLLLIYILINVFIGYMINRVYGSINSMNKGYITYTTDLITLKDSKIDDIADVKDLEIGIIDDKESIDGYVISQEIIKENKLSETNDITSYTDYSSMMDDLYNKKIDALFISDNYPSMFQGISQYENIKDDTKIIFSKNKKVKKDNADSTLLATNKPITEPFTILLMGVDSEMDGLDKNSVGNGDALILITFNPKTLNATMLSIPRDTYVPIACFANQIENKITHAAWHGESCMIKTIQNFTDINIDYYVKINFKGVVGLVDALGGIDVEVPQRLCTDDSNRGKTVCINEGLQHLDGEGALVLSRNRKQLDNGDIGRGLNQQLVIQAMINQIKNINNVNKLLEILDMVSRNMDTNLTTEQILSFYNIAKDILSRKLDKENGEIVNVQHLFIQGNGQMIYDENTRMVLWNYVPVQKSIDDVVDAMKVNLALKDYELIKEFDFSINEDYEKEIIGEGPYKSSNNYTLLPDFTGDTKEQATKWASANGVKVTFVTEETNAYPNGTVFKQSEPANKRTDKLKGSVTLTLAASKKSNDTTTDEIDCSKDKKNKACLVPDFTKMTKQEIISWVKPLKNVNIKFEEVVYPGATAGQIVSQSVSANTYLGDTINITIGIAKDNQETVEPDDNDTTEETDE